MLLQLLQAMVLCLAISTLLNIKCPMVQAIIIQQISNSIRIAASLASTAPWNLAGALNALQIKAISTTRSNPKESSPMAAISSTRLFPIVNNHWSEQQQLVEKTLTWQNRAIVPTRLSNRRAQVEYKIGSPCLRLKLPSRRMRTHIRTSAAEVAKWAIIP